MVVPGTPLRITPAMSASVSPCMKRLRVRSGPLPPPPAPPWQPLHRPRNSAWPPGRLTLVSREQPAHALLDAPGLSRGGSRWFLARPCRNQPNDPQDKPGGFKDRRSALVETSLTIPGTSPGDLATPARQEHINA